MKRYGLAAILPLMLGLAVPGPALAAGKAASSRTVELVPQLAKGDRLTLEITKTRTQSGRPAAGGKGFQVVEVEVIQADEKGYLIGWTSRRSAVLGPDGKPKKLPPQAARFAAMYDGVQMIFQLSPRFELVGLKNFEQVQALMTRSVDKLLEMMPQPPEQKAQVRKAMTRMLATPELLSQAFGKGISLFFSTGRLELPEKGAVELDYRFPLPIGGGVIPAKMVMEVTKLDRAAKRATVSMTTKMDPVKAAEAMRAAMAEMARQMGKPAPTEKDLPRFEVRDEGTFVMDLATNLPLSVEHTRTAVAGPGRRVDTMKIVRKPAAPKEPERK